MIEFIFMSIFYGVVAYAILCLSRRIIFSIFNREAFIEYFQVCEDIKHNRIPYDHSEFIIYNQSLKFCKIIEGMNMSTEDNDLSIKRVLSVIDPYSYYLEKTKDESPFYITILTWSKR